MNSAATVTDAEPVLTFDEWRNQAGNSAQFLPHPDSLNAKLTEFMTGYSARQNRDYQTYLDNLAIRNEARATQSARAWDEYMSNTAYSRAFADLERAGVNPYILLNSGSSPSTSVGSASKPSYSYSKSSIKTNESNVKGRDFALILLAIARLAAALQRRWTDRPVYKSLV